MAGANSPSLGNTAVGALLRSANARMIALENLHDEQAAYDYARSGYTDEAYADYSQYLKDRLAKISARTDLTSASKALTLTKTLDSAGKSNLSAQITRENIQMMAGNATTTDKLALVMHQAEVAQSLGDLTLYQHLEEQAYSLSQQVQKEQADAQVASATLAQVNGALSQLGISGGRTTIGASANADWVSQIRSAAKKYGVDPQAALAVASAEGLGGGVGDNGTSFGPFQLHVGGALPAGKGRAWAESAEGIDYALSRIAGVAKGLTGQAAVEAIVNHFERPANPSGEIQRAMQAYGGNITGGPLSAAQARIASGNYTLQDLADAGKEQLSQLQQGYVAAADMLKTKLGQFNQDFTKVGKNGQQTAIDSWVKSVTPALQKLGVNLPVGAKPNYGDLLQGVYLGLNKIYGNAAIAASAFDPASAEKYTNQANAYATGQATIPTLVKGVKGGNLDLNLFDLKELAYSLANPASTTRFMATANGDAIEKPQAGLQFVADQGKSQSGQSDGSGPGVIPAYLPNPYLAPNDPKNWRDYGQSKDDPNAYQSAPLGLTQSLNALHLSYQGKSAGQGDTVVVTDASPGFLKKIAKPGQALQVWLGPTGLQFAAAPSKGAIGSSVYTVARDGAGKQALYEDGPDGSRLVGGEYGYNLRNPHAKPGTGEANGFLDNLKSIVTGPLHNMSFASLFGGGGTTQVLADASSRAYQIQQAKIAEANRQAALALLARPPAPLPSISVNNAPAPAPIRPYSPPPLKPVAINRAPVQPVQQRQAPAPGVPAPSRLQGGNVNLQGGGNIRLQ